MVLREARHRVGFQEVGVEAGGRALVPGSHSCSEGDELLVSSNRLPPDIGEEQGMSKSVGGMYPPFSGGHPATPCGSAPLACRTPFADAIQPCAD
jgi:hypothetical protein